MTRKCRGPRRPKDVARREAEKCADWFPRGDVGVDDVAQEARVRIWRADGGFDPARGTRAQYERVLARSAARRVYRGQFGGARGARKRLRPVERAGLVPDRWSAKRAELRMDLERVLATLTDEQRALCELLGAGLSGDEIATRLGVARSTVYRRRGEVRVIFAEAGLGPWLEGGR